MERDFQLRYIMKRKSARETYSCANELSTLCWNFTEIIKASFLPVQQQLPIVLSRLPKVRFCECSAVLTTLASPRSRWEHRPVPTLQDRSPGSPKQQGPAVPR